ncbi:MAG: DUF1156 domain-containing protein [Paracoccaceae bacterium]
MKNNYKKKLIEVAIPLEAINAASAREKSIRHGHPSTLHLWWARRPLAACRAVLFCQLVNDPSEYVDKLLDDEKTRKGAEAEFRARESKREQDKAEGKAIPPDEKPLSLEDIAIELERKRLFKIIEELVKWENSTNEEVLERARAEIRRCCGDELPPVYDPFSGGGSIPLEAQRLGLPAYGSDLNPVAVMIGKAMIEIPPKFKDMEPIHPGGKERNHYRNAEGLAEDVKYYGDWVRARAWERIGHLYPEVALPSELGGGTATVIAWIWARTVPSPDPAFASAEVPLVSSYLLTNKKGKEVYLAPTVDKISKTISFSIETGGGSDTIKKASKGNKLGRANFSCFYSDAPISGEYVDAAAAKGLMGRQVVAAILDGPNGQVFVSADDVGLGKVDTTATRILDEIDLSALEVPCRGTFASNAQGRKYGFETFKDYYLPRQLVALATFSDLIEDLHKQVAIDARAAFDGSSNDAAKDYANAIALYFAFAIDRMADAGSSMATWSSSGFIRFTYARQGIAMTWDFVECNPFSRRTGGLTGAVQWIERVLNELPAKGLGKIEQADAQTIILPQGAILNTDPPYYDNMQYSDLSDYFYVWLRRSLKRVFPDLTRYLAVPKSEELIASPYRHDKDEKAADRFFLDGMTEAMSSLEKQSNPGFPAAIYYAFKQSEVETSGIASTGWATFLSAVIAAGFSIVGTWPVRTERSARIVATGTNALANSVVLVCRKKEDSAETITRAEFIRALKRELPPAIAELQAANVSPADMPQSAIGPGMGVFSRYAAVLEADDNPMTVKTALQLINRELDEFLNDIQGEFDPETRFSITWYEQNGLTEGDFGSADSLARARGISVDEVKHAGIVKSEAGRVRIFKRDELLDNWDPNTDPHITIWECCQYLISALENEGEYAAALLLKKLGADKAEAVKDLAYCLYDICSNKRKEAKEATSYNALIAVWTELTRQAATISDYEMTGDRQTAMNI